MKSVYQSTSQLYMHNRTLETVEIPPRKILQRACDIPLNMITDTPKLEHQNYLPVKDDNEFDEEVDLYSSEEFRIYEFKVRMCTRKRNHDWSDCPFAHPGEKARRRDPKLQKYSSYPCPEFQRSGSCTKGDDCYLSHGIFESRLHPRRYRTEKCKDGKKCLRKICFFAHTPRQLRVLPRLLPVKGNRNRKSNWQWSPVTDFEPEPSPQLSLKSSANLIQERLNPQQNNALGDINKLFDVMNLNKASNNGKSVSFNTDDSGKKIVILPPKLSRAPDAPCSSRTSINDPSNSNTLTFDEDNKYDYDNCFDGPDFGWVNDLLT